MNEVTLENYRCFRQRQSARLAPLTLLVGDNSTGKTSFLALIRALWDAAFGDRLPDFKESPYDLGSFDEIVSSGSDEEGSRLTFKAGFRAEAPRTRSRRRRNPHATGFTVDFIKKGSAPFPALRRLERSGYWVGDSVKPDGYVLQFGKTLNREDVATSRMPRYWRQGHGIPFTPFEVATNILLHELRTETKDQSFPQEADRKALLRFIRLFRAQSPRPFATAPVRSRPRRSYDPAAPRRDSEGDYIPMYLAHLLRNDESQWEELKTSIESFGSRAGLFAGIRVRQLGTLDGDPFQIQVKRPAADGRAASFHNLVDVGYGVSQVLPIITELFRPGAAQILLLQQPEVHLHPSAQAALGTLFCEAATGGRQLIVETHSDHLIDRVRMDVRDSETRLHADDVSLLFFERRDPDVRIHSLRFDDEGNIIGAPEGYRRFFMEETHRIGRFDLMCAILDASVVSQVFGTKCPPAGEAFFEWIAYRHGRVVVGGKLDRELARNSRFRLWFRDALLSGKAEKLARKQVDAIADQLTREGACRSNDAHVIALAQLSDARLLYSNDKKLNGDFLNAELVPPPSGNVYTTLHGRDFTPDHQALLDRKDLCRRSPAR